MQIKKGWMSMKRGISKFLKFVRQRIFESGIMLLVVMLGVFCIVVLGHIGVGIGFIVVAMATLAFGFWYDTVGAEKLTVQRRAKELKRVKQLFLLKEGEMVEVLLTPTDSTFTMQLSLNIQQTMQTRYFAVLKGEEISIIAQIGDVMTKPEKMNIPSTLEYQFTPISNKEE